MALIAKGRQKAFEELYQRYYRKLVHFTYCQLQQLQMAEDIVQDVFIKIIEKPERFDTGKKFSTWVYTVTANAYRNAIRNDANRARLLQISASATVSTVMPDSNDLIARRIQDVLCHVSEKEKLIYTLRFEMDLSIAEIAAIAGIPQGSVKSCIFYLLKKLRPQLKDLENG